MWLASGILLLAGLLVIANSLPAMITLEKAEKELAVARQNGDLQAEGSALEEIGLLTGNADYLEQAGSAFFQEGDLQHSQEVLEKAEDDKVLTPDGYIILGNVMAETGDKDEAVEKWKIGASLGAAEGFNNLVDYYRGEKDWQSLDLILRDWMTVEPEAGYPTLLFGLLRAAENESDAVDSLRMARKKNRDQEQQIIRVENAVIAGSLSAYAGYQPLVIGRALGAYGYWDLAEISFRLSIESAPDYAEAWAFLSESLYQQGEGGEIEIQRALELNPQSTLAQALYAVRLRREGNSEEALEYLLAVTRVEPEEITWRLEIAATLAEMGKINEALTEFQAATGMDENNTEVWKQLARFCIQYNMEVRTTGLQAARQALNLAPNDVEALDLMGWTFFLLEDHISAERFLNRALEIDEMYANAYLHLGQVYLDESNSNQAYLNLLKAKRYSTEGSETWLLANRLLERYFGDGEEEP